MLAALKARFNGADDFCLRELTAGGQVLYALFLDGMTSGQRHFRLCRPTADGKPPARNAGGIICAGAARRGLVRGM